MFINAYKEALPYLIKANITPMLVGNHGVGKSQANAQICAENGWHLVDLRLGTQETGDLVGLGDFEVDEKGKKISTQFMPPKWLTDLIKFCNENPDKKAVIFLDEINRARRDVLQAVFQLVLDKRLHTVVLPENAHVVAAMNPNNDGYIVSDISDKAFLDRFCHIKLTPSTAEWFKYAEKKSFKPELLTFLKSQTELLQDNTLTDINFEEVKPSRRSWEAVNKLLNADTPPHLLRELVFGLVGVTAGQAFITSLKDTDKPITGEEILKNFKKHKESIVKYSDSKTGGRIQLVKHTCDSLHSYLENRNSLEDAEKRDLSASEGKNLMAFLKTIPLELSFNLCRDIYLVDISRKEMEKDEEIVDIIINGRKGAKKEESNK